MESTESTRPSSNRTGMQTSPQHSEEMLDSINMSPTETSEEPPLAAVRLEYIRDADPLGSIPRPAALDGLATTGAAMITLHRPQIFVDKLAERLAFERGGTRLYDAVLVKFQASPNELRNVKVEDVREIRDQEAEHVLLIKECIEQLGADPTAQTPGADLVGVQSIGLLQAASDPRTSLAQTLSCALAAELIDNAGWENLIALAQKMGKDELVSRFRQALQQENEHLKKVRSWYDMLTVGTAKPV